MGFCYGGPYAILGPKRLGYAAGISCHGTRMLDFIDELDGVTAPVCIIWGDQDHAAPAEVLDAYRAVPARIPNVEVHIFPGVLHGYMMRWNAKAFHPRPARSRWRDPAFAATIREAKSSTWRSPAIRVSIVPARYRQRSDWCGGAVLSQVHPRFALPGGRSDVDHDP